MSVMARLEKEIGVSLMESFVVCSTEQSIWGIP